MHTFDVWAPTPTAVQLWLDGALHPMTEAAGREGWWTATVDAKPDARYGFVLGDDDSVIPDPRSPRQPDGVHEASQLHSLDPASWTDQSWTGRRLAGSVSLRTAYRNVHGRGHVRCRDRAVGTPRRPGCHDGRGDAGQRLQRNTQLGLRRRPAGTPSTRGTAVRTGCSASSMPATAADSASSSMWSTTTSDRPETISTGSARTWRKAPTPGGRPSTSPRPASDEVRRYISDNALRWFREFHIDALRLDAVHAIVGHPRHAHSRTTLRRDGDSVGARSAPADVDRRERLERPEAHLSARGRWIRTRCAVGRRHPSLCTRGSIR